MVTGYLLGIGGGRRCGCRRTRAASLGFGFVWLIRSVPMLVQLLFWYELASLYPKLSLGIPFGPEFVTVQDRAPVQRDPRRLRRAEPGRRGVLRRRSSAAACCRSTAGQIEAAQALGLGRCRIFRRIVLPQAMPAIVPASGNLLIGMLKATSIVSVIAVQDLLYSAQLIYNQNYQIIPLLLVATLWYIILTTVLSVGQYYVERHYARGQQPPRRGLRHAVPAQPAAVRRGRPGHRSGS